MASGTHGTAEAVEGMDERTPSDEREASGEQVGAPGPAIPPIDWSPWVDGKPRRLKRGKHYVGDPKPVAKDAEAAAAALGRHSVASRDSSGKYEYLWIQWVEGEVELGRPCPVCGGLDFEKIQKYFLRCSACGSRLRLAEDVDIVAGRYDAAAASAGEAPEPQEEPIGELAEVIGIRLLDPLGEETGQPNVREGFELEVSLRTHRPMASVNLKIELAVPKDGVVVRLRVRDSPRDLVPGVLDFRVRVPPDLLVPKEYSVEVAFDLQSSSSTTSGGRMLRQRDALVFQARDMPPRPELELRQSAYESDVTVRP